MNVLKWEIDSVFPNRDKNRLNNPCTEEHIRVKPRRAKIVLKLSGSKLL